jgi:hypothetical protein
MLPHSRRRARPRLANGARRAMLALYGLGWLWSLGLTVAALAGAHVSRPRFEAAGLTLGFGLVAFAWLRARPGSSDAVPDVPPLPRALVLVPAIVAVLAFGWSLTLGPLSDDFVLWRWARAGSLAPGDWPYFRPLALAIWRGVFALGGGWMALHLVNVTLHAFNSALVGRIGSTWMGRRAGLAAGVLFAAFPASTEAVAWTAGVCDLLATASVLSAVAIAWWMPRSALRNLALLVVCAAGLLSKESAVVIPAVLLVVSVLTPRRPSPSIDWAPVVVSAGVAAAFLMVRAAMSPAVAAHFQTLPADRRGWKDLLVRPFAGLALPVRTDAGVGLEAYLLALLVLAIVGIMLLEAVREGRDVRETERGALRGHGVAIGALWIVLGALPLLGEFYVSPTLAGGRYLYLPSAGFAWLVSAALAGKRARVLSLVAEIVLVVLVGAYVFGLRVEQHVWREAAATRDAILSGAAEAVRATPCRSVSMDGAPEDVNGAYVFRSGLREALDAIPLRSKGRACVLRWTGRTIVVAAAGG